jgi:hypothetical protein
MKNRASKNAPTVFEIKLIIIWIAYIGKSSEQIFELSEFDLKKFIERCNECCICLKIEPVDANLAIRCNIKLKIEIFY